MIKNLKTILFILLGMILLSLFIEGIKKTNYFFTYPIEKPKKFNLDNAINIKVSELLNNLDKNEESFNELYKNKILYITGKIDNIEYTDSFNKEYILSLSDDVVFEYRTVNIKYPVKERKKLINSKKGDVFSAYVIYNDYVADLYIDCNVVN